MKTSLLIVFLSGLITHPNYADGVSVPTDSLNPTRVEPLRPDSIQSVRPDSTHSAIPAVSLTGELTLSSDFYVTQGPEARMQWTPYRLNGNFTLTTRSGWMLPVQLMGSSAGSQSGQSANLIGISPRYKHWLIGHGGYGSVLFSPLTLAGYTFMGGGIELNPGLLRVGVVAGRFNRAVNARSADPERIAQFRRMGYSARLGVGNERNYLDVILLRAADKPHSIRPDSLNHLTPAENAVLGLSGRLRLRKKLSVEFDAAGSAYTGNVRSEGQPIPFGQAGRLRYVKGFMHGFAVRSSTRLTTALKTSLVYRLAWADLKLQYRRIEPGYQSMGAYYIQSDVENFTLTPALRLFKKRLYVRTSVGWQRDNLFGQKKVRTNRLISSVSASYMSTKDLTIDLAYANYGLVQRAGYRPLNDTIRLAQNNRTLSGSVFKLWTGKSLIHTLSGSATYQALQDRNPFTVYLNQYHSQDFTFSYMGQHPTTGLDLNVSYGYTRTSALAMRLVFYGPSVSVGKKLLNGDKLNVLLTASYLKSREIQADLTQRGLVLNTALTLNYQLTPVHRLSVNWTNVLNRSGQTYREQRGSLQWFASF